MKAIVTYKQEGLSVHQTIEANFPLQIINAKGICSIMVPIDSQHVRIIFFTNIISIDVKPSGENLYTKDQLLEAYNIGAKEKLYTREEMFEATWDAVLEGALLTPHGTLGKKHKQWFDKKFPI